MTNWARKTKLLSALREVVILVLSILIAFGLDAWWGSRVEQRAIEESLEAVTIDLQETQRRLHEYSAIVDTLQTSLSLLLSITGPTVEAPSDLEMKALIGLLNQGPTLAPVTGAIESMVQSGQIAGIKSDSLRLHLASWDENLRDFTEDEGWGATELMEEIRPYLAERIPLFLEGNGGSGGAFLPDYQDLLRDLRFANLVGLRLRRLRQISLETSELNARIEEILRLIRATLS